MTYEWQVTFRNDTMGFQKTFYVVAERVTDAISVAAGELKLKGYDPFDFAVIKADRRVEVA